MSIDRIGRVMVDVGYNITVPSYTHIYADGPKGLIYYTYKRAKKIVVRIPTLEGQGRRKSMGLKIYKKTTVHLPVPTTVIFVVFIYIYIFFSLSGVC